MHITSIILAAGEGVRMRSKMPKILQKKSARKKTQILATLIKLFLRKIILMLKRSYKNNVKKQSYVSGKNNLNLIKLKNG